MKDEINPDVLLPMKNGSVSGRKGVIGPLKLTVTVIQGLVTSAKEAQRAFDLIMDRVENVTELQNQIKGTIGERNQGSSEILSTVSTLNDASRSLSGAAEQLTGTEKEMEGNVATSRTSNGELLTAVVSMEKTVVEIEEAIVLLRIRARRTKGLSENYQKASDGYSGENCHPLRFKVATPETSYNI